MASPLLQPPTRCPPPRAAMHARISRGAQATVRTSLRWRRAYACTPRLLRPAAQALALGRLALWVCWGSVGPRLQKEHANAEALQLTKRPLFECVIRGMPGPLQDGEPSCRAFSGDTDRVAFRHARLLRRISTNRRSRHQHATAVNGYRGGPCGQNEGHQKVVRRRIVSRRQRFVDSLWVSKVWRRDTSGTLPGHLRDFRDRPSPDRPPIVPAHAHRPNAGLRGHTGNGTVAHDPHPTAT